MHGQQKGGGVVAEANGRAREKEFAVLAPDDDAIESLCKQPEARTWKPYEGPSRGLIHLLVARQPQEWAPDELLRSH